MAPSDVAITAALKAEVKRTLNDPATRGQLTVRYVRERVQEQLGLRSNFFLDEEWKARSKVEIKRFVDEVEDEVEQGGVEVEAEPISAPQTKPSPKLKAKKELSVKKGTKRESAATKGRPAAKRQKQEEVSSVSDVDEDVDMDQDSAQSSESEFGNSEDSDAPQKAKPKAKMPVKKGRKSAAKVESGDEDLEDGEESKPEKKKAVPKKKSEPKAPAKRQTKAKPKIEDSGDDSSLSSMPNDEDSDEDIKKKSIPAKKSKSKVKSEDEDEDTKTDKDSDSEAAPALAKKATPKISSAEREAQKSAFKKAPESDDEKADIKTIGAKAEASDSEMSVLIDEDEAPKKKRRSKSSPAPKSSSKSSKTKAPKAPAPKTKAPAAELSSDEQTMKTLQSQLKKCGINKIWAFELKQYGDDAKKRIKHLKKALLDVGMPNRFSEAKAREIKEMRELQADLEAVKEGEKNWGMESGRAKRGAAGKKAKVVESGSEDEGEVEGGGDDDGEESEQPAKRKPNARSALAFLGSESDD